MLASVQNAVNLITNVFPKPQYHMVVISLLLTLERISCEDWSDSHDALLDNN